MGSAEAESPKDPKGLVEVIRMVAHRPEHQNVAVEVWQVLVAIRTTLHGLQQLPRCPERARRLELTGFICVLLKFSLSDEEL